MNAVRLIGFTLTLLISAPLYTMAPDTQDEQLKTTEDSAPAPAQLQPTTPPNAPLLNAQQNPSPHSMLQSLLTEGFRGDEGGSTALEVAAATTGKRTPSPKIDVTPTKHELDDSSLLEGALGASTALEGTEEQAFVHATLRQRTTAHHAPEEQEETDRPESPTPTCSCRELIAWVLNNIPAAPFKIKNN